MVATIGALVGATELFTRYRDAPRRLFGMLSFHLYWAGNAGAAAAALLVVRTGAVSFGQRGGPLEWLVDCAVAGFGSMLLLRSAVVVLQGPNGDQPIGPGLLVTALLDFVEDIVRRNQAEMRSRAVARHMTGVDYEKAAVVLPRLCLGLMASTSPAVVERLLKTAEELRAEKDLVPDAKALLLATTLIDFCGEGVLREAVRTAASVIAKDGYTPAVSAPSRRFLGRRRVGRKTAASIEPGPAAPAAAIPSADPTNRTTTERPLP